VSDPRRWWRLDTECRCAAEPSGGDVVASSVSDPGQSAAVPRGPATTAASPAAALGATVTRIQLDRRRTAAACALVLLAAAAGTLAPGRSAYALAGIGIAAAVSLLISQRIAAVLVGWVAIEGIAYPFVRYPIRHDLLTFDRVVLLSLAGALVLERPRVRLSPPTKWLVWAFALFVAVYGARAALTHQLPTAPGYQPIERLQIPLDWLERAAFPLVTFLVALKAVDVAMWGRLARALSFLGASVAFIGLAEWKFGFELATLSHHSVFFDPYAHVVRVSGPYGDPTAYGGVLVVCIAATCFWVRQRDSRWLAPLLLLLEVVGLAPSYTKTIWLAGLVTLILGLGVSRRVNARTAVVAAAVAVLVAGVYVLSQHSAAVAERVTGSTQNFWGRLGDYQQGFLIFEKWPLFGAGFDQFINAQQFVKPVYVNGVASARSAHNTLISVLAETGLAGFIPLILLIVAAAVVVHRYRRLADTREEVLFGAALLAATVGVVLLSMTLLISAYPPALTLYALFLGTAAARIQTRSARTAGSNETG